MAANKASRFSRDTFSLFAASFINHIRLAVFLGEVHQRRTAACLCTCLIFAVIGVDILDELPVQQMERNVLRTYSGAFSAVRTAACNVECTDDVEHILFEGVCCCLLRNAGCRVIKNALLTAARRADIAAGITADAAGQLSTPERIALVRSHRLQLFYHIETTGFRIFFSVFAQHFVINNNLMALADFAAFQQAVLLGYADFAVHGVNLYGVAAGSDAQDAFCAGVTYLFCIQLAVTRDTDDVNIFTLDAVFRQQLVKAVGITGFQENQCLAVQLRQLDQILGQVAATEIVIYKIFSKASAESNTAGVGS